MANENGVLSNFTRSHISSDRVRSGYEIRSFHAFSDYVFFFLFCSRPVAICLVRTKASVLLFTKQTATFVPARKYSQGDTAKKVTKLKRRLGTLARTTSPRTHPKMQFLQLFNWIISKRLDCKFCVNFLKDALKRVKFGHKKKKTKNK